MIICFSAAEALPQIVTIVLNVTQIAAPDILELVVRILFILAGFGLLYFRNWARRMLIILLCGRLMQVSYALYLLRNTSWDPSATSPIIAIFVFMAAAICLLIKAAVITQNPQDYQSRRWLAAGIV